MTPSQLRRLAIAVVFGLFWIGIGQHLLFQAPLSEIIGGGGNVSDLLSKSINPAFQALWVSCAAGVLIWFWVAFKSNPGGGVEEILKIGSTWWMIAFSNVVVGWGLMVLFVQIIGQTSIPAQGWLTLLIFVILDVIICFWLPTLMATPRNFRLIVPGAVKFFGER